MPAGRRLPGWPGAQIDGPAPIDWGHPLTEGLQFYATAAGGVPYELVTQRQFTLNNGAQVVAEAQYGMRTVSASNQWFSLSHDPRYDILADITMFWMGTLTSNTSFPCLASNHGGNGNTNNPWQVRFDNTGRPEPFRAGATLTRYRIDQVQPFNQPISFGISLDGDLSASGFMNGFINGSSASTVRAATGSGSPTQSGAPDIRMGRRADNNSPFDGSTFVCAVWNRKLGADEHQALHANPYQLLRQPKPRRLYLIQGAAGAITGTLNATLADVTAASAGAVLVSGASAVTLGAATLTAAGTATVTGAATITLAAATASSAGTVAVVGAASVTLAANTSTAAGTVAIDGDAAITLGAVTLSASGVVGIAPAIGTATITLAAQTLSSAGTVAVAGAATVTLADATLSATGTVSGGAITGAALITLGGQTLASAGAVSVTGAASILLDSITTAVPDLLGQGLIALDAMTCAADGEVLVTGDLAAFLQSMQAQSGVYEAQGRSMYNAPADDRRRIGTKTPDARRVIN